MGQKVNPHGFRVGPTLNKDWDSIFYAEKDYSKKLLEDLTVRKKIQTQYKHAQVSRVEIKRPSNNDVYVNIYARKPGVIIGKSGADIEKLKKDIHSIVGTEVFINIHEVKKPAADAHNVAQTIAMQIENRGSFRKAMKTAIDNCLKYGCEGIKVSCSGRLSGAEIARTEWYREGRVPLHTLRADIDYATFEANTTYGVIGIKVWIYKGPYQSSKKGH